MRTASAFAPTREVLCTSLLLSLLSACGQASAEEDTDGQGAEASAEEEGAESNAAETSQDEDAESGSGDDDDDDSDKVDDGDDDDDDTEAGSAGDDGGNVLDCEFSITSSVSEVIPTVGIVEWSLARDIEHAHIEFGEGSDYNLKAPVDLESNDLRTLLLGMKPTRSYKARVIAETPEGACQSQAFELETGPLSNALPQLTVDTPQPEAIAGDYIVDGIWQTGPAFVLDKDGDYVWWYGEGRTNRARMSWDGQWMYIMGTAMGGSDGSIYRVRMDGSEVEDLDSLDGIIHHDFTVLPEGGIAFIAKNDDGSDSVRELTQDGEERVLIEILDAHGGDGSRTHANALHYLPEEDAFTVSDLSQNCFLKFGRDGEVHWVLGGTTSDFAGDGAEWNRQHGHHLIDATHFLFFNNNGAGMDSLAIEVELDHGAKSAKRVWSYDAGLSSNVHGDVQRLANGNTSITYSVPGIIHEVAPDGSLVRELAWSLGGALGYSSRRQSLYGPPDVP